MDIKAKIDEIVNKVKNDPALSKKFNENPIGAVEEILGIDLPDDQVKSIVDGVKAKISADDIKDKIGGFLGGLKK